MHERRVVPPVASWEGLAVSRATFRRDLGYLHDWLNAPGVWPRKWRRWREPTRAAARAATRTGAAGSYFRLSTSLFPSAAAARS
ncbi:MAG: hypothetical protein ACK4TK_13115, partial [Thiobacillaceae bacterium]